MSLRGYKPAFYGAVVVILLAFVFGASAELKSSYEIESLEHALADATAVASQAVYKQKQVTRRHDLAIEFGFNPIIVEIVDDQSRKAMLTAKGDEFRLIQTQEYLTHIFLSLIYTESQGNVNARGDKGKAYGLTQIWLSTARDYVAEGTLKPAMLYDPQINIEISFLHFRHLLKEYRGNFTLALLAWNRGENRVNKIIAWGQSPANGFGAKVFNASIVATRYNLVAGR